MSFVVPNENERTTSHDSVFSHMFSPNIPVKCSWNDLDVCIDPFQATAERAQAEICRVGGFVVG